MRIKNNSIKKIEVVAAFILKKNKLLAALRSPNMSSPNLWELPGGKLEFGEDDQAALRREIMEELGVDVHVGVRLGRSRLSNSDFCLEMRVYHCEIITGEPVAKEHSELRWILLEECQDLSWAPADVPLLSSFGEWFSFGN